MELLNKISEDFMSAYKNKDMESKNFLGLLKSEVTKETKTPDDAYIIAKIKSMIKSAADTNSLSELELEILNKYLPKQMDENELTTAILSSISSNGYEGLKDMGKVMSDLKSKHDGMYDGKIASQLVKTLLA